MAEAFDRRALLLKAEVTEQTDSVPVVGTNALQFINGTSGVESDKLERQIDRQYWGNDPFVNTRVRAFIQGDLELAPAAGAGNVTNPISPLLLISGFAETLVAGPPQRARYSPVSTGIPSATAYWYQSGTFWQVVGCRCAIDGISMAIGSYAMLTGARILGRLVNNNVTEAAVPTPTYTAFQAPVPITHDRSVMSINGVNVEGKSLEVKLGIELDMREHTEGIFARMTNRKPTGTVRFYRPLIATLDPFALWQAGTLVPIVFQVDNGSKLTKCTVNAQLEEPKPIDIDGDHGYELAFRAVPSAAGNDEVLLEFGNLV